MSSSSYQTLKKNLPITDNNADYVEHIMNSFHDAVAITDLNENIIFMNAMAEKLSDWETADALGKPFNCIFSLKDPYTDHIQEYKLKELSSSISESDCLKTDRLQSKNGCIFYVNSKVSQLKIPGKGTLGYIAVFRTVKCFYLEQQKKLKNKERINALLKAGNLSTWTYDINNQSVSSADYFLKSLGYSKDQITTHRKEVLNKVHPADREKLKSSIENYLKEQTSGHYVEIRILNIKQQWIWFYVKASLIDYNEQGEQLSVTGIFVNIDKIKKTQSKLHDSHHKLEKTTSLAKVGYFEIDLTTKEFMNFETISQLFNITTELKMSSDNFFSTFVHPDYVNIAKDHFMDFILKLREYVIEFPIIVNKKIYWTKVLIVCDPDRENYAFGIMQDITSIKKNEKALKNAKKHAENSDKLKSAFLANMSHEIRTPLNSIVGFSHLLVDGRYSQDQCLDFAKQITQGTKSLLEIVEDILDISKIESGNYEFYYDYIDLHLLFQELERICNLDISPDLKLEFDSNSPGLHFNTDRLRLRQTMMCLLKNAIKFTVKGKISFGYILSKDKKHIHIFVKDNGPGIPVNKQDIVFQRFVKLNPNSTGTGLGLSISKAIIENLGGRIQLESRSGKGCKFIITLPIKDNLISKISY